MTVITRHIPESPVPGKPLGRHVDHDDASRQYPAEIAQRLVSVRHDSVGLPLDQADVGKCTAEAVCGALNSDPNRASLKHGPFTDKSSDRLYKLETKNEGQPWPPNDPGGSGLAVCKAATELGWITSYTHAFGIVHALRALVVRPVITGVNWYTSFDVPDTNGLVAIAPDATVRGAHEFEAVEIIVPRGGVDGAHIVSLLDEILIWFWNSWGPTYGVGGRFSMTAATWLQLLREQGDVTVPIV